MVRILVDGGGWKEAVEEVIMKSKNMGTWLLVALVWLPRGANDNGYLSDGCLIQSSLTRHGDRLKEVRLG